MTRNYLEPVRVIVKPKCNRACFSSPFYSPFASVKCGGCLTILGHHHRKRAFRFPSIGAGTGPLRGWPVQLSRLPRRMRPSVASAYRTASRAWLCTPSVMRIAVAENGAGGSLFFFPSTLRPRIICLRPIHPNAPDARAGPAAGTFRLVRSAIAL